MDLGGQTVILQLGDGIYAQFRDLNKPLIGGRLIIQGNTVTPANTHIAGTGGDCVEVSDSHVILQYLKLSNSAGAAIHAYRAGVVEIGLGVDFGACSEGHCFADNDGQIIAYESYKITGGGYYHRLAHSGGYIGVITRTITLVGTPTFTGYFDGAVRGGHLECADNTYVGTFIGKRFLVDNGGNYYANNDVLPGTIAGSNDGGFFNNGGRVSGVALLVDGTTRTTTSTVLVATPVAQSYVAKSPTSSLLIRFEAATETERSSAGASGMALRLYRYDGAAYVAAAPYDQEIIDTDSGVGASEIRRHCMVQSVILTATQRRSDMLGQWTFMAYFRSYVAGCTAKFKQQTFTCTEFEPS